MNTLQITRRFTRSSWGGTETVVLQLCRELKAAGHAAEIVTSKALDPAPESEIDGVSVRRFDHFYPWLGLNESNRKSLDDTAGNLFSWGIYRHLQRSACPDIVHLHTGKRLGGIARKVCEQRNVPYVVSLHGGLMDLGASTAERWAEPTENRIEWGKLLGWWVGSRRVLDDAAAILCVGKEERERVALEYPNKAVHYLPNGVDTARFATGSGTRFRSDFNLDPNKFMLLQVGRIDPQKNQLGMLARFSALLTSGVDAQLVLIGHPSNEVYFAQVQQRIENDPRLRDSVLLIPGLDPNTNQLIDAYAAADLFVLPSEHEPFGVVALEAWAAGLPVIASHVGGLPGFIEDGKTGMLLPANDDAAWIRTIRELMSSAAQRSQIAAAGLRTARQQYDWQAIAQQLLSIYQEAAA